MIILHRNGYTEPFFIQPNEITCCQRGVHVGLPEDKLWTDVWIGSDKPVRFDETPLQIARLRAAWSNRDTNEDRYGGSAIIAIGLKGDALIAHYAEIATDTGE